MISISTPRRRRQGAGDTTDRHRDYPDAAAEARRLAEEHHAVSALRGCGGWDGVDGIDAALSALAAPEGRA